MESGDQGLFWGVILKPDKRYEQIVEEDFRITKACVDPSTLDNGKVASVILEKDNDEFIICNLSSPNSLDNPMDLAFAVGEKVTFRTEGGATVHLTGHVQPADEMSGFPGYGEEDSDSDAEEEEGEEEEEEASDDDQGEEEDTPPKLVKKRKMENGTESGSEANGLSAKKQKTKEVKQAEAMKKILLENKEDDEDEDDDDSDEYEDMEDDMDEVEEESDDEEEATPAKPKKEAAKPKETPKAKKEKKKEQPGSPAKVAANGEGKKAEKVKAEQPPQTPKAAEAPAAETPKSKKKKKNKKNKDSENDGQEAAKTPAKAAEKTPGKDKAAEKTPGKDKAAKTPAKKTLKGGIQVEDIKVGNGPEAKSGKMVGMYYEGKLTSNGKKFDACKQGKPFKFKLGKGEVIKGWDLGLEGIRVGGKRKLIIPAQMGYGSSGAPPAIPPNASLTFEVECKTVN